MIWKRYLSLYKQAFQVSLGSGYQERLISDWEFDESAGARFDIKGLNHLTDNNTVTSGTGVANYDSRAAVFVSGNSEYLSRAAGTITGVDNKTDDFSIETAFKINANITTTQTIYARGATANNIPGFWLFLNTSSRLQITFGNGTSRVSVNPTNALSLNTLYHVVCTFDRDGNMSMYINNALGSGTGAASISGVQGSLGNNQPFNVGAVSGVTYADMNLGFLRIWDGLLSTTDISYLYNSGNLRSFAQL